MNDVRAAGPLAIAVLFALLPSGCHGERDRARALAIDWREGQSYRYAARLESRAGLTAATSFDMDLAATLALRPLRVAGSRVELAMTLSETKLAAGGGHAVPGSDPLMAALAAPYLFTLDAGRIVEQRFPAGISSVAVGILRTLAAGFQLADRPPGAEQWTAREHDVTGPYQAEYQLTATAGGVTKHKRAYEGVMLTGTVDAAARARLVPKIVSSTGELRVAEGALASIRLEDAVESQVLVKSPLTSRTKLTIALTGTAPAAAEAPDRSALLAATAGHPIDQPYDDGQAKGRFAAVRLDGRTFEQLRAALEAGAKDSQAAELWGTKNAAPISEADRREREARLRQRTGDFDALVALLHEQPDAIPKAVAAVRAGSPAANGFLDGLASAGTDPTQAALCDLVLDRRLAPKLKATAAASLIRVQVPTTRTVETLKGLVTDSLLADHAVYGLGTAARRLGEAGEAARSRELGELLVGLLAAAKTPAEQIRCLRGIANSAYPGALGPVRALLGAEDYRVRAAAVEATRLMAQPAVDQFLTTPLLRDPDARVRIVAVEVASRRPPSGALEAALTEVALHDSNVAARKNAVELLGRWLPGRRNLRTALEEVASKDERPEIRAAAEVALSKA